MIYSFELWETIGVGRGPVGLEPIFRAIDEAKMDTIQYDDFAKIDLKIGTVIDAKPHPNADKLLILKVKLGDEERQIIAGVKAHYTPIDMFGKQIVVVTNLEPRTLRGETSHGMLLAASDDEGNLALLTPDKPMKPGSKVK